MDKKLQEYDERLYEISDRIQRKLYLFYREYYKLLDEYKELQLGLNIITTPKKKLVPKKPNIKRIDK